MGSTSKTMPATTDNILVNAGGILHETVHEEEKDLRPGFCPAGIPMSSSSCSVSPTCCCPLVTRMDERPGIGGIDEEDVDPKLALVKEPIVGFESTTWTKDAGHGAIPARPLPSPKQMSDAQRRIHDITHLPYDPRCAICVSCRRPNDHHRTSDDSKRTIPLVLAAYAFPRNMGDEEPLTVLVMRVYPYTKFVWCAGFQARVETPES